MQEIPVTFNFIALLIILGVFLGIFISFFIIKNSLRKNLPNLFMGCFIGAISLVMLEGWLDYSSYIFQFLWLSNFAEPLNFVIAPLIYLFVRSQFIGFRKQFCWMHFLPFALWAGYCVFYYVQADVFKYNSSIDVMQLDFPRIEHQQQISNDPLRIRSYVNLLTGISFIIYNSLIVRILWLQAKLLEQSIFKTTNTSLISIRNSMYHFLVVVVLFVLVKLIFKNDVGDYFIHLYLCLMLFMTVSQIMNKSTYYNEVSTFLSGPILKYEKSSLSEENKLQLLEAITNQFNTEKYYTSGTASLSGLAKAINASSHHVSQVINEKLNQTFFELLASYRIEEAKTILKTELGKKLTIEEVAERVGYNSKSAFNNAFKKFSSQTPSSFRDS